MARRLSTVDSTTSYILLGARMFMASLAVFGGILKLVVYSDAVAFASSFHIPYARQLMPIAILIELGGAIALLTPKYCRPAAIMLALWTFVLGIWFHPFWSVTGAEWQMVIDSFFHHFVMTGGFVYVAIFGADGNPITIGRKDRA